MNTRTIKRTMQQKRIQAEAAYDRAVRHLDLGHYRHAAIELHKSLGHAPHPKTYYVLSYCLKQSGHFAEALNCIQQTLRVPEYRHQQYYLEGGNLARDAGIPAIAKQMYVDALTIGRSEEEPDANALLYVNLGLALMALHEFDDAASVLQEVLKLTSELDPYHALAACGIGTLHLRRAEYDEAKTVFTKWMKTHSAIAAMPYAELCIATKEFELAIKVLEEQLALALDDTTRRKMLFHLGKAQDALGLYDAAFESFAAGNASKRVIYDPKRMAKNVRQSLVRKEYQQAATPDAGKQAVFIIGMPRSGTSLVEQILSCHPDVHAAGEFAVLHTRADAAEYPEKIAKLSDARYVTNKQPYNFLHLGEISAALPGSKIIHCTRNRKDTILSIFMQDFTGHHAYAYSLEHIRHYYEQYRKFMAHWEAIGVEVLEVHYEDVVQGIDVEVKRMLKFLDLPQEAACLTPHTSERIVNTASIEQVRQPLYTTSINRWKHYEKYLNF